MNNTYPSQVQLRFVSMVARTGRTLTIDTIRGQIHHWMILDQAGNVVRLPYCMRTVESVIRRGLVRRRGEAREVRGLWGKKIMRREYVAA
jgi:hypothetical protein